MKPEKAIETEIGPDEAKTQSETEVVGGYLNKEIIGYDPADVEYYETEDLGGYELPKAPDPAEVQPYSKKDDFGLPM